MKIVISQVLNALTMVSPLICWFKTRKKYKTRFMHKLLIFHIPFSFFYHLACALPMHYNLVNILKKIDFTLIHLYAMTYIFEKKYNMSDSVGLLLNTYCIYGVMNCKEQELLRICSLIMVAHNFILRYKSVSNDTRKKHNTRNLYILGISCTMLYMNDNLLCYMGHPLFHILLGKLHIEIFKSLC